MDQLELLVKKEADGFITVRDTPDDDPIAIFQEVSHAIGFCVTVLRATTIHLIGFPSRNAVDEALAATGEPGSHYTNQDPDLH